MSSRLLTNSTASEHLPKSESEPYINTGVGSDTQQEAITISQVFERDGFTLDRITNIQLSINPDGISVVVTTPEAIQAVWDTLSNLSITPEGADQASINDDEAITIDIQFANPNFATHVTWYGPIVIHGREYYTFAEGFSEQTLYDLISEFIEPEPFAPIEEIHTASFADDGCLLFNNEHYELKPIPQEITPDSEIASFTTETAIEGIVWSVFTIKEYPNREHLLLMSGTNSNWLCCLGCPRI
jgi:hypothetical protein